MRMAFNEVGILVLNPGQTIEIEASFPDGLDLGAQYFSANPKSPSKVIMSNQSKSRDARRRVVYGFTVTIIDQFLPAICDIQGGGFI